MAVYGDAAYMNLRYSLDARVKTPFGVVGIVKIAGVDHGGNLYLVQLPSGTSDWFYEHLLSPENSGMLLEERSAADHTGLLSVAAPVAPNASTKGSALVDCLHERIEKDAAEQAMTEAEQHAKRVRKVLEEAGVAESFLVASRLEMDLSERLTKQYASAAAGRVLARLLGEERGEQ